MTLCRHFHGEPVTRLIASVPTELVQRVDALLREDRKHPARRCRSEYVRLALAEKLKRDRRHLMKTRTDCARARNSAGEQK